MTQEQSMKRTVCLQVRPLAQAQRHSISSLARQAGIPIQTVRRYWYGTRDGSVHGNRLLELNVAVLEALAGALGVGIPALFTPHMEHTTLPMERVVNDTFPDVHMRELLAEAVHEAICLVTRTDGSQCCALYAATAANLMPSITGHAYTINSGSFEVGASPEGDVVQFDAEQPLLPDAEFHSMLVRHHAGRFEVADLASRHWRTWALRLGGFWHAPDPPPFIWCWHDELQHQWPYGLSFAANEALTKRHITWLHGDGAPLLRSISGQALLLLRAQGVRVRVARKRIH
jgi:hypothetical protein